MGLPARLFAALLVGAPTAGPAADSTGTIEGRVVDAESGAPVAGARVLLEHGRRFATTAADGRFAFPGTPPGVFRIEISHIAYRTGWVTDVRVSPGERASVEARLERNPLRETVVVRSRPPPASEESRGGHLSGDEAVGLPGTLEDPGRALTSVPGVSAVNDFKGEIRIHGGEPEDTLFRMDGVTLSNPYHFRFTRASVSGFNLEAFDEWNVRTSSLAPAAGETISGVVDLTPSERGVSGGFLDASVGSMTANVTGGAPLAAEGSWLAAGRYSSLALYREFYDVRTLSLPVFRDLVLRARAPISPKTQLIAGGLGLASGFSSSDPKDNSSTNLASGSGVAYAGLDTDLASRLRLSGRLARERSHQRIETTEGDDLTAEESRLALSIETIGGDPERPAWRLGLEQSLLEGDFAGALRTAGSIRPLRARSARAGAHASFTVEPATRWAVDVGARIDRDSRYGTGPLEPRISATYSLSAERSVWLSADRYAQFPRFEQEFLAQGEPLRTTIADELSAGAAFPFSGGVRASVAVFSRRLRDPSAERVNQYPDLPEPVARFDRGWSRGLDLGLRKDRGRLRSRVALSYLRTGETLDGTESPSNGDQPFRLDASAAWLLTPRWELSGRFQTSSGLPYSSWEPAGDGGRSLGPLNGARLPTYARLDVRGTWDFARWKGRGRLYLEVDNALGRTNVRGRDLRYDPSTLRYYYHDEAGMPLVPVFGLEISWGD